MKTGFRNVRVPFDPKYPNAWRGQMAAAIMIGQTTWRISWSYRPTENDYRRVDTSCTVNISPFWAKWFHYREYYAGMYRYMRHLTIGRLTFSYIPNSYSLCL